MRIFYFLLLFGCFKTLTAQSFTALVNTTPQFVNRVDVASLTNNQLFIAMPFAKDIVLNPQQKKTIAARVVIKLELVYTKYKTVATFNQKKLNTNRFKNLNKLLPNLFKNRLWNYELISQTNGNSRKECHKMFHGFILTFRPISDTSTQKEEIDFLDKVTEKLITKDTIPAKKIIAIKTHYDMQVGYLHDTIWVKDTIKPIPLPDFLQSINTIKDSTVLQILNRNKNWKNFIVSVDATGSMSPYIAQIFNWLIKLPNQNRAKCFVFFNDGNNKADNKKETLNTKGIYMDKNTSVVAVNKLVRKCIKNGNGGDTKENDVEAILAGVKYYPKADEIILIADNYANMRDYAFISKIKKPVHIILCGAENRINIQYLDLARQTKGSVHTTKSDVNNLSNIKENEHFFIDDKEYMYKNGRFHSIYSLSDKYR